MAVLPAALPFSLVHNLMVPARTTTHLLTSIRQRGQIPTLTPVDIDDLEAELTTDTGLLRLATAEMRTTLVPKLRTLRSNFLIDSAFVDVEDGTARYRLPSRAMGSSLDGLFWRPSGGTERDEYPITAQRSPSDSAQLEPHFAIEGAYVVLRNFDFTGGSLRMVFPLRPSRLVATSRCAVIDSVTGTGPYTINLQAANSVLEGATQVDVIRASSLYEVAVASLEVNAIGVGAVTVTTSTDVTELEQGDYLCLEDETPVVPLPEEWHELLAQLTAVSYLEKGGYGADLNEARKSLEKMERALDEQIERGRVQGAPQKVRNTSMWGRR